MSKVPWGILYATNHPPGGFLPHGNPNAVTCGKEFMTAEGNSQNTTGVSPAASSTFKTGFGAPGERDAGDSDLMTRSVSVEAQAEGAFTALIITTGPAETAGHEAKALACQAGLSNEDFRKRGIRGSLVRISAGHLWVCVQTYGEGADRKAQPANAQHPVPFALGDRRRGSQVFESLERARPITATISIRTYDYLPQN